MRGWMDSLGYHALVALSITSIVIGSIPFLKVIAVYLPGRGLQEAITQ